MKHYIITSKKYKKSIHGGHMWEVELMDLDGKTYKTYLDPKNHNYKHWEGVITAPGVCIVSGLRPKIMRGKSLINADSKPRIVWNDDEQYLADAIANLRGEKRSNWDDIFE